ncbi:MAG: sigma-70 family RNA polymerase sigma factor [Phycisphaerales bacterium]
MTDGDAPLQDADARRLTAAMAAGEREAYAALFSARVERTERDAARILRGHRHLVDDAVQETWIRVARRPVRCDGVAALDAWLTKVTASAAVDLLRSELARRVREERVARSREEAACFLDHAAVLEDARQQLEALSTLETDDRGILELRTRVGRSVAALAEILGVGSAALDSRVRRATARARQVLEGALP